MNEELKVTVKFIVCGCESTLKIVHTVRHL